MQNRVLPRRLASGALHRAFDMLSSDRVVVDHRVLVRGGAVAYVDAL